MSGLYLRCCHKVRKVRSAGFTLIEVLLVLVILVILGSIAVPMYRNVIDGAKVNAAKVQVQMLDSAIDMYHVGMTQFPSGLGDLINPPSDQRVAQNWRGPYLKNKSLIDPWEDSYEYTARGVRNHGSYDVWSLGPDRANGTGDDIGNWE